MSKYHIPYDFILLDGENDLHEKVDKDLSFSKYYQEFNRLIAENIPDNVLKIQISEACRIVYVFAEIAAFREGFKEGVQFLSDILNSVNPEKASKRVQNFNDAFERFLGEYHMDRIADVHDFLLENVEYNELNTRKEEKEKTLQASISDAYTTNALLDYLTYVEFLIDKMNTIFYEHGFHDCITITRTMQKSLYNMSLHPLYELNTDFKG